MDDARNLMFISVISSDLETKRSGIQSIISNSSGMCVYVPTINSFGKCFFFHPTLSFLPFFLMVVMFLGTALGLYYYSNVCDAVVMHNNGVWGCSNYIIYFETTNLCCNCWFASTFC